MKTLTSLLPYQVPVYEKLKRIKVNALYLDMGLGKTRIAIEMIMDRFRRGKINHVLWLCPCSVKTNLKRDVLKHSKGLIEHITIMGIESISQSDRTYLKALSVVAKYKCYLIVDESNLVKNYFAKRTQRITELSNKCPYRSILNGTPVTKNEADLFSQWYILDRRIFGYRSFWSFANNHLEYNKYGRVVEVLNVDYLTDKMAPYSYQLKKADVLKDLPPKSYDTYYFGLTEEQEAHYEIIKMGMLARVDEFDSTTIYRLLTALQLITSGRKITNTDEKLEHEPFFKDPMNNPRMMALERLVRSADEKHIIWCKYTFEIEDIQRMLIDMGKEASLLYGDISLKRRDRELDKFRGDTQFLIANKASGGYGLNLQFCNNMIYYSEDFNWGTRAQSEDRVHRIGQENKVFITDIVADSKIDERIMSNQQKKVSLDAYITYLLNNKNKISEMLEGVDNIG